MKNRHRQTMKKIYTAIKRIKCLEKNVGTNDIVIQEAIKKILNEDQIKLLTGEYKKMPRWSNEIVHKALKYKFTCGSTYRYE